MHRHEAKRSVFETLLSISPLIKFNTTVNIRHSYKSAFTLIEIILVLTLLVIAFTFSVLYHQTSQVRADLRAQTQTFVSYLRLAESNAALGKNSGQSHGIHLETTSYTLFIGNTYNASATTNFTIQLPTTLKITTVALNGNGSDIIFSPPKGETTTYGSVTLTSDSIQQSLTVQISSLGSINL